MFKYRRHNKLLNSKDFRQVFTEGKKTYIKGITILACSNNFKFARIGFAIGKKKVNKAFQRNTIKRVAKEAFRHQQTQLSGVDYIVLVNKTCLNHNKINLFQYFQQGLRSAAELCNPSSSC